MPDNNSKNIGYPSQLAIFLGLTGGGLVIGAAAVRTQLSTTVTVGLVFFPKVSLTQVYSSRYL